MDLDQAAEALANANSGGTPEAGEQAAPPSSQAPVVEGAAENADSLFGDTPINPDDLPEELQPLARQLQGVFTRKTQGLAEQRKAYEALGDIDPRVAAQAVEFYHNVSTDPQFALTIYQQLETALEEAGYLVDDEGNIHNVQGDDWQGNDGLGDFGDDAQDTRVQELEERLQRFEAQQEIQANIAVLQREEAFIRSQHPEYDNDDLAAITELAFAHGGSLIQAEQVYSEWNQRVIGKYMGQKSQIPAGVAPTPSGGHAAQPRPVSTIDEAHKVALEMLKNQLPE